MHGLTGGSWKRGDLTRDTKKNDPTGNRPVTAASRPTARQRHRASFRPYLSELALSLGLIILGLIMRTRSGRFVRRARAR